MNECSAISRVGRYAAIFVVLVGVGGCQTLPQTRHLAEQGDAKSQYNLGQFYRMGRGVPQDDVQAVKWYRKAAIQGLDRAQFNLASMYRNGQGVPQAHEEAVKWFRKAAEQGLAPAQYNLGVIYERSQGVPKDDAEAVKWFRKAAEQGFVQAQYNLGYMYRMGQGVPQDYTEAIKWLRKATEQGDADAQFYLGAMYAEGRGVPQDYTEAVKWYRKAAIQDLAHAQFYLGIHNAMGRGVPQDYTEAIKWLRKAVDQGNADAQLAFGLMYYEGRGVPQDYAEAEKWIRKSAEQGNADAQGILGVMYNKGRGVPQDYTEAYFWYSLANRGSLVAKRVKKTVAESIARARGQLSQNQIAAVEKRVAAWQLVNQVPINKVMPAVPTPTVSGGSAGQVMLGRMGQPAKYAKPNMAGYQQAVHLASFRTRKAADRGWSQMRRTYKPLLDELSFEITRVDLGPGKGSFFRLKVGPMKDKAAAADTCRKLKSRGQFCELSFMYTPAAPPVPEKPKGLTIPTKSIKAPTVVSPQPVKPVETQVGDEYVEKKLETIKRLLDRGLITEEEAAAKRVKLLEGI